MRGIGFMYETPRHLAERQRKDLEKVPLLGLGFVKTTLNPQLHGRLLAHLRSNVRCFKPEPTNDFLRTESARSYPSLLHQNEEFNQQPPERSSASARKMEWAPPEEGGLLRYPGLSTEKLSLQPY